MTTPTFLHRQDVLVQWTGSKSAAAAAQSRTYQLKPRWQGLAATGMKDLGWTGWCVLITLRIVDVAKPTQQKESSGPKQMRPTARQASSRRPTGSCLVHHLCAGSAAADIAVRSNQTTRRLVMWDAELEQARIGKGLSVGHLRTLLSRLCSEHAIAQLSTHSRHTDAVPVCRQTW